MTYTCRHSAVAIVLVVLLVSCKKDELLTLPTKVTSSQPSVKQRGDVTSARNLPINLPEDQINVLPNQIAPTLIMDTVDAEMANHIFRDLQSKGESLRGRFFADGQFAYVGNIRRYIQNSYDLVCGKLFLFGDVTGVSPYYGCSAAWNYDVACVLWAREGGLYILDPRLFTRVVKKDEWIESHTIPTSSQPHPSKTPQSQLVPGDWFAPTDVNHVNYLVDSNFGNNYYYTDLMVSHFADSVGCRYQLN